MEELDLRYRQDKVESICLHRVALQDWDTTAVHLAISKVLVNKLRTIRGGSILGLIINWLLINRLVRLLERTTDRIRLLILM